MPFDQHFTTVVTARVLEIPHHPRQVSRVNVAQTGLLPNLRGSQQVFRARVLGIVHLVVLVKRGHVPGNVG